MTQNPSTPTLSEFYACFRTFPRVAVCEASFSGIRPWYACRYVSGLLFEALNCRSDYYNFWNGPPVLEGPDFNLDFGFWPPFILRSCLSNLDQARMYSSFGLVKAEPLIAMLAAIVLTIAILPANTLRLNTAIVSEYFDFFEIFPLWSVFRRFGSSSSCYQ